MGEMAIEELWLSAVLVHAQYRSGNTVIARPCVIPACCRLESKTVRRVPAFVGMANRVEHLFVWACACGRRSGCGECGRGLVARAKGDEDTAMQVRNLMVVLVFLALFLGAAGCAYVVSQEMRREAEGGPEFSAVIGNPDAYRGKTVIWGGIILDTINEEDATLIKVLETPLDYEGMPTGREYSRGRFLARIPGYADREVYLPDSLLTVAGEISGKEVLPEGEIQYTYPVLLVKEKYLWVPYRPPYAYGPPAVPFWYGYPPGYWYGYPPWFFPGYPYPGW